MAKKCGIGRWKGECGGACEDGSSASIRTGERGLKAVDEGLIIHSTKVPIRIFFPYPYSFFS